MKYSKKQPPHKPTGPPMNREKPLLLEGGGIS